MLTKREIVDAAAAENLGERNELEAKFRSWQRFGLIGTATTKEAVRGGAGLWHSVQERLFFLVVSRQAGVPLWAYAGYPVGFWLLGVDGVEVGQAERALFYWVTHRALGSNRPEPDEAYTGSRSFRERMLRTLVSFYSAPSASPKVRKEFLDQLRNQVDGAAASSAAVPRAFEQSFVAVASPARPSSKTQRDLCKDLSYSVRFWVMAADVIDWLCADRRDVHDLWGWVQRYAAADLSPGKEPAPRSGRIRTLDLTDEEWDKLHRDVWISPVRVLSFLGVALRTYAGGEWSSDWIRPPAIKGLVIRPNWAAEDALPEMISDALRNLPGGP